jgi:mono/diheme cytochrome c family protein
VIAPRSIDATRLKNIGSWAMVIANNLVAVDGRAVGGWRRVVEKKAVVVETLLRRPLDRRGARRPPRGGRTPGGVSRRARDAAPGAGQEGASRMTRADRSRERPARAHGCDAASSVVAGCTNTNHAPPPTRKSSSARIPGPLFARPPTPQGETSAPPFEIVQQIFDNECVSCHTQGADLDLTSAVAWGDLVGVPRR